jgi:outer membrane protein assembly factor BamE
MLYLKFRTIAQITIASAFGIILLSGCSLFHPYKTPVQQGRILTDEQISSLKPGMTEDQVKFILGTPGTTDPFTPNAWYYVYTHQEKNYPMTEKQLIVIFKDHQLIQINGNYNLPETT